MDGSRFSASYRDSIFSILSEHKESIMFNHWRKSREQDSVSKTWREFRVLLEEAVIKDNFIGAQMLLEHASFIIDRIGSTHITRHKEKCIMPLILAVESGKHRMIKLFLRYNYDIPLPHLSDCRCDKCQYDKYGQLKHRLLILKALSNPVWISLTSRDPFMTLFRLYQMSKTFCKEVDSFQREYEDVAVEIQDLCLKLLHEVRSEDEGTLIMRHSQPIQDEHTGCNLSFINAAIEYQLKEVTAHPITQHFLIRRIFDEIPGWHTSGIIYKIYFTMLVFMLYPITTLVNILFPFKCCSSIGNIAMKPLVKFINGVASYTTFLVLLAILAANQKDGLRSGNSPSGTEIAVFVWLIGLCVGECKQMHKRGISDYLSNGWNWVDMGMDVLMLYSFSTWTFLYYQQTPRDDVFSNNLLYIADGAFTLAIGLSFFRIIYVCKITSYLGLLQLTLGGMVMVIVQFAFVCLIVLLSFSVALVFLFNASGNHDEITGIYDTVNANKTAIFKVLTENFNGFFVSMFTLACVGLQMKGRKTVNDFADGSLIHLWSNICFITYLCISMIFMLNMLIAMMNTAYQVIHDNITTEHKYARTTLWMEYVGNEHTRSVPFNLIPTLDRLKRILNHVKRACHLSSARRMMQRAETCERNEEIKYCEMCDVLMGRYLLNEFGFCISDTSGDLGDTPCESNDPFLEKIRSKFEEWRVLLDQLDIE